MHYTETNNPKKHNTHQIPKFQISDLMHLKDEQNLDILHLEFKNVLISDPEFTYNSIKT